MKNNTMLDELTTHVTKEPRNKDMEKWEDQEGKSDKRVTESEARQIKGRTAMLVQNLAHKTQENTRNSHAKLNLYHE
jgi:hypothetical protein